MPLSASETGRWAAVGLAAVLLAGCSAAPEESAAEPPVVLTSPTQDGASPTAVAPSGGDVTVDDGSADDDPDDDQPGQGAAPDDDDHVLRDAPTVTDESAELDVEDQRGDGRSVRIDEVRFASGDGMVGIYDAGLKLLGWAAVTSGVQPVRIDLDRRLGSSQELIAVLHRDDGDGRLDAGDPVVVEEGEQVSEDFDYLLD